MSSGFVSEKELAEARVMRQQEWEKVRTADQPLEMPEEKYDSRSLYDRLQEQKQKRDIEFEESRKLKNMIKGLDDDEVDFLDLVDQKKLEAERNKNIDEQKELLDYRNRVANLQEKSLEQRLHAEINSIKQSPVKANETRNNHLRQNQLLKGGLVLKKPDAEKKRKLDEPETGRNKLVKLADEDVSNGTQEASSTSEVKEDSHSGPVMKCIGILPGIVTYASGVSSSESDSGSSDIEDLAFNQTTFDLVGRKIVPKKSKEDD